LDGETIPPDVYEDEKGPHEDAFRDDENEVDKERNKDGKINERGRRNADKQHWGLLRACEKNTTFSPHDATNEADSDEKRRQIIATPAQPDNKK